MEDSFFSFRLYLLEIGLYRSASPILSHIFCLYERVYFFILHYLTSAVWLIVTCVMKMFLMRLQARKLEAQLDEQMNSFRKLVSTKVSTNVDTAESDVESGIERLLKQLQQVNSQMQAWVSSGGSEMVSHTLTRHQEILQDLTQVPCLKNSCLVAILIFSHWKGRNVIVAWVLSFPVYSNKFTLDKQ